MSTTKVFYSVMNDFLNFLEKNFKIIGDEDDVKKVKKARIGLEMANKTVVVKEFYENLKDHSEKIYERDEEYFLSHNILDFGVSSETHQDSLRIKTLWNDPRFTSDSKEIVWDSIEALLGLSMKLST